MPPKDQKGNSVANAKADETEKAVVAIPEYRNSDLQAVTTFEDALALMRETYGDDGVITADEVIGNGFAMLANKDNLIGVPFAVIKWQFYPGKFADNFVTAMVVTADNRKFLINDGGTGICSQLQDVTTGTGRQGGMVARHGLTRSEYEFCEDHRSSRCNEDDGQEHTMRPAVTYYIDTSAAA